MKAAAVPERLPLVPTARTAADVVWEHLSSVAGDTQLCGPDFAAFRPHRDPGAGLGLGLGAAAADDAASLAAAAAAGGYMLLGLKLVRSQFYWGVALP